MAVMDAKLLFSEDVAPGAVGAHDSTNIINLGIGTDAFGTAKDSNPGQSGRIWLNIVITGADIAATGGAATIAFALQDCATVGGSYVTRVSITAIAKASLTLGTIVYSGALPIGLMQFLKLVVTVATNDITAGTYSAWLGAPFETAK